MLEALAGEHLVSRVLACVYAGLVAALAAYAVVILRLRCEGFGCTGIGVAWIAWTAIFVLVFFGGVVLRSQTTLGRFVTRMVRASMWIQMIAAAVLVSIWITRQAAG